MSLSTINGFDLVRAVKSGCINLEHRRDQVDLLNVFPVPDGDTGTNMYLTLLSAVKEGEKHADEPVNKVMKAISMGSLMGARGNSGVILSQIFRGMAHTLENKEVVTASELAWALKAGSETAYKAVMKPVEGTILTVTREIAHGCELEAEKNQDILAVVMTGVKEGYKALEKTPQLLPVLKEAGVVDAGGQGFLYFLQGFVIGLAREKEIELEIFSPAKSTDIRDNAAKEPELEFQYCTEVLVKGQNLNTEDIKDHLTPLGNSMLVVGEEELVKVHIHSNHPGKVLETCLQFGNLSDIKINNMAEEVHEQRLNFKEEKSMPDNTIGIVAVAAGEGILEILKSLGVDEIVEGGQTMNPSTEDILSACNRLNKSKIIILPNNKNVIMAAEQVKELSEKEIAVFPSQSVMQAITALIAFDADGDLQEVVSAMKEEIEQLVYAEITCAVRDSSVNGLKINTGDFLGILNGEIFCVAADIKTLFTELLPAMLNDENELITLLYGQEIPENDAKAIKEYLTETYQDYEIEMHYGGQAHYHYLLSVE